ncbi:uncharacterized protein DS421_12g367890 [Arachis hypogaea]|nr:uncharacterized protein DS421_12g367890 [Arachis hypogaea]
MFSSETMGTVASFLSPPFSAMARSATGRHPPPSSLTAILSPRHRPPLWSCQNSSHFLQRVHRRIHPHAPQDFTQ